MHVHKALEFSISILAPLFLTFFYSLAVLALTLNSSQTLTTSHLYCCHSGCDHIIFLLGLLLTGDPLQVLSTA